MSLLFILFHGVCFASDSELALKKTQEGNLTLGKAQPFVLTLNAGDLAQIKLEAHGTELVVVAYDPSSNKLRGAKVGPDGGNLDFVADSSGVYRVEVKAADRTREGTFTITLDKTTSLVERLAPRKPAYESPRIRALKAAVESGQLASVGAFWEEIKRDGTPIIEPLGGDEKNKLVTFVWRGNADTHTVLLVWFPYAAEGTEDFHLTRLGVTDVWYKTLKVDKRKRFMYTLAPNVPRPYAAPGGSDDEIFAMIDAAQRPDPLNPKRWAVDPQSVGLPTYQGFSVVEMPEAPAQPWLAKRQGVAEGAVDKRRFKSTLLKNERDVAIYLPLGYEKSVRPYPLLILFDGDTYLNGSSQAAHIPAPIILDNLISEHRIPPIVALLVGNAPGARNRELPCNPVFADFLVAELLPWAHNLYNFTTDPQQTIVGGSSYGGLAAAYAGLRHPEAFGNILSQSGSFSWTPSESGGSTNVEPDWLAKQFIASPRLQLRFYMDAGSDEIDLSGHGKYSLSSGQNLRDVLLAKGYEVHFQEFEGGHDYLSWRGTLADGLILLIGGKATEGIRNRSTEAR